MFGVGFGVVSMAATANTLIQLAVPDGLRGRVMASTRPSSRAPRRSAGWRPAWSRRRTARQWPWGWPVSSQPSRELGVSSMSCGRRAVGSASVTSVPSPSATSFHACRPSPRPSAARRSPRSPRLAATRPQVRPAVPSCCLLSDAVPAQRPLRPAAATPGAARPGRIDSPFARRRIIGPSRGLVRPHRRSGAPAGRGATWLMGDRAHGLRRTPTTLEGRNARRRRSHPWLEGRGPAGRSRRSGRCVQQHRGHAGTNRRPDHRPNDGTDNRSNRRRFFGRSNRGRFFGRANHRADGRCVIGRSGRHPVGRPARRLPRLRRQDAALARPDEGRLQQDPSQRQADPGDPEPRPVPRLADDAGLGRQPAGRRRDRDVWLPGAGGRRCPRRLGGGRLQPGPAGPDGPALRDGASYNGKSSSACRTARLLARSSTTRIRGQGRASPRPPATWDEFLADLRKVKTADAKICPSTTRARARRPWPPGSTTSTSRTAAS